MMETDDKLIREFFGTHKTEIADNGFSRRVMRKLPDRNRKWAQVLTLCLSFVAVTLFYVFDGLHAIIGTLRDVFVSMVQQGAVNFDPRSLIIVVVVLCCLGVHKVYSMI